MSIEILTSYFEPYIGGIETVVLQYARGLGMLGHKVCVHTGDSTPNAVYRNLPHYEEHEYYTVKRYTIFPYSLIIPELVYKDSILSLHNYSCLMNDYVALVHKGRRKVLSPYGNVTYELSQRQHPHLAPIYDRYIGGPTLSRVDAIVAMTQHEKKGIIEKYPHFANKVEVVPAGMNFNPINKLRKKRFEFPYFVSVGRVIHTKRFDDVLHVLKYFPKFHYVLAGRDVGYAPTLLSIARKLGVTDRFHYVGEVSEEEKVSLLSGASVFVMPDSANAFGIANLEAFYYLGKVVATRSGGMAELSEEMGGEVFSIGEYKSMKKAIEKELAKKIDLKAKQKKIKEKYSWDAVVRQYEKVLMG